MQRRFLPFLWAFTLLVISLQAAGTAQAASYVVAPFQVVGPDGYGYLQKSIPSKMSSSLFWDGHFDPVAGQDAVIEGKAPKNQADANKLLSAQKADYVVWGSLTIVEKAASLHVSVLGADGRVWQKEVPTAVDNLMGGVQLASDSVSVEVFGRPVQAARSAQRVVAPMNPDFVVNESQADTVYLNPQIRFQGVDDDRLRSQRVNIESHGMEVADFNGDGKNEVLLFDEYSLYIYKMEGTKLNQLDSFRLPTMLRPLSVRSIRQGGNTYIVLSCYDTSSRDGASMIFNFVNNKISQVGSKLPFYTSVAKLPPLYEPAIIGQYSDRSRIVRGSVFEVIFQGGAFTKGPNLSNMPKDANVFNFAWVPGNSRSGGDYAVVLSESENLLTFDTSGHRLAKSDDRFSGGSIGIPHDKSLPGLGVADDEIPQTYYVPMRMITVDLDKNGTYELILNRPISTAGQLFNNYRTYPQGEIHALVWDGIGMDITWKTRRIKGTVVDLALADADNDGVLDLVVNVNTYPGTFGTGKIRSLVTLYPLDLTLVNPNTPVASDF